MRLRFDHTGVFGGLALLLLLSGCFKKNENINPARLSILQYIDQSPSLSILDSAIHRVRLDTVLSSGGPYTIFAPNDSAFQAAGLSLDSLRRMKASTLLEVLEYQVVAGRISADDLPGFVKQPFTSLHPIYQPFITKSYYGIFINGVQVSRGESLGDGIVQVTGRVVFPPTGSQLEVMHQSPDMRFFAALVNHVQPLRLLIADSNANSAYNGFSSFPGTVSFGNTLLVPTDSAFRAFGYLDSTSLYNDSTNLVYGYFDINNNFHLPLLLPYILNGFIFTADLRGNFVIGRGSGVIGYRGNNVNAYLVTSLDGMSITGAGISPDNPIKILGPDIVASNGVIQKINQVFISHN